MALRMPSVCDRSHRGKYVVTGHEGHFPYVPVTGATSEDDQ
jgi:hypothetical protein